MKGSSFLRWTIRRLKKRQALFYRFGLAFLCAFLHVLFSQNEIGRRFEAGLADQWFRIRGTVAPPQEVAIIAVDEASYDALGASTLKALPRALLAQTVERIREYHPKLVFFDYAFVDLSDDAPGDQAFALALKSVPTLLGSFRHTYASASSAETTEVRLDSKALFAESAGGIASTKLELYQGVVRRFPPQAVAEKTEIPTVIQAVAERINPAMPQPSPRDLIHYYGPARTIRSISLHKVLAGGSEDKLRELFQNTVVVVGAQRMFETSKAGKDTFVTPFPGEAVFGSEIFATMIANVLRGEWIRRAPVGVELLWLNLCAFLIAYALTFLSSTRGLLALLIATIGWSALSYRAFLAGFFIPGATLFVLVLPAVFLLSVVIQNLAMRRAQARIESLFDVRIGGAP